MNLPGTWRSTAGRFSAGKVIDLTGVAVADQLGVGNTMASRTRLVAVNKPEASLGSNARGLASLGLLVVFNTQRIGRIRSAVIYGQTRTSREPGREGSEPDSTESACCALRVHTAGQTGSGNMSGNQETCA